MRSRKQTTNKKSTRKKTTRQSASGRSASSGRSSSKNRYDEMDNGMGMYGRGRDEGRSMNRDGMRDNMSSERGMSGRDEDGRGDDRGYRSRGGYHDDDRMHNDMSRSRSRYDEGDDMPRRGREDDMGRRGWMGRERQDEGYRGRSRD